MVINRCMLVLDTNNYFLIYEKTLQFSRGPPIPILYPHKPWSTCTAYTYIGMSIDRDNELLETRPAFANMWSNCKCSKPCLCWYPAFSTTIYQGRESVTITPNVCCIEWFVFNAAKKTETLAVYTHLLCIWICHGMNKQLQTFITFKCNCRFTISLWKYFSRWN